MTFNSFCKQLNVKMTRLRQSILSILWHSSKPLKAYDILEKLKETQENAKPPTVYRVLDYLVAEGIIHKLPSIQSYTLCCHPNEHHHSADILMICHDCLNVTEIHDPIMHAVIEKISSENKFSTKNDSIEIRGLCAKCQP